MERVNHDIIDPTCQHTGTTQPTGIRSSRNLRDNFHQDFYHIQTIQGLLTVMIWMRDWWFVFLSIPLLWFEFGRSTSLNTTTTCASQAVHCLSDARLTLNIITAGEWHVWNLPAHPALVFRRKTKGDLWGNYCQQLYIGLLNFTFLGFSPLPSDYNFTPFTTNDPHTHSAHQVGQYVIHGRQKFRPLRFFR